MSDNPSTARDRMWHPRDGKLVAFIPEADHLAELEQLAGRIEERAERCRVVAKLQRDLSPPAHQTADRNEAMAVAFDKSASLIREKGQSDGS